MKQMKRLHCHKRYIKYLVSSYVSSVLNVKINVQIQYVSKLIRKTTEKAVGMFGCCLTCVSGHTVQRLRADC
jgi:hypothetical protein